MFSVIPIPFLALLDGLASSLVDVVSFLSSL